VARDLAGDLVHGAARLIDDVVQCASEPTRGVLDRVRGAAGDALGGVLDGVRGGAGDALDGVRGAAGEALGGVLDGLRAAAEPLARLLEGTGCVLNGADGRAHGLA